MFNFRKPKEVKTTTESKDSRMATFIDETGTVFGLFFVGLWRTVSHDTYSIDAMYEDDPEDNRAPIDRYNWLVKFINRRRIALYKEEHWDGVNLIIPIFPFRFSMKYRSLLGIFNTEHNVSTVEAFGVEFPDEQCGGHCVYEHGKIRFNNGRTKRFFRLGDYQLTYKFKVAEMI